MATIKSIEEKAKAYDEALKVAKSNYETIVQMDNDCTFAKEGIVNTFHHIFPELKESEDERIRKEIIAHIKWCEDSGYCAKEEMTRWIAWLEKQQGEHKPAWSEEDIEILESCISLMSYNDAAKEETDWLKSLKDRVQPQQKQEWSEEDAYKIDKITKVLDYVSNKNNLVIGQIEIEDLKNWLKSLKERYTWKPSDEQMEYLSAAIEESNENPVLDSLYQDLKKL